MWRCKHDLQLVLCFQSQTLFHGDAENCFPISAQAARDHCSVSVESVIKNNKKKNKNRNAAATLTLLLFSAAFLGVIVR